MASADVNVQSPLEVARQLAPLIRAAADEIERERELPRPLFEALADAGLFRLAIPRSLGGFELDLPTYARVIEVIGQADASTAWALNQGAIFATYAAHLPPDVAREIWIDTPRGVVANSPAPAATATAVEGGYRVSGRLGFSTGCRHASWLAANARVIEADRPRLLPDGEPETRYLFVPAPEAEILDTWHVRGMRGTGTHHFRVDGVFVPEERSFIPASVAERERGPLYLFQRTLLFASGDAAIALGVARSSLEAFVDLAGAKEPYRTTGLLRDQARVQSDVGLSEANLRSARALLFGTLDEVWDEVGATGAISLDQRVSLRLAAAHAIRLAVQVVDAVYNLAGTTAIFEGNLIQRLFQDIHVISQHIQSRLTNYELVGRHFLGLPTDEGRV